MLKSDVIRKLCEISGTVGRHFHSEWPYDCFCAPARYREFQFAQKILTFIEQAVTEKIERDGAPKSRWED